MLTGNCAALTRHSSCWTALLAPASMRRAPSPMPCSTRRLTFSPSLRVRCVNQKYDRKGSFAPHTTSEQRPLLPCERHMLGDIHVNSLETEQLPTCLNCALHMPDTLQIDTTAAVYAQLSNDPPVTRSQPPIAGAVRWSRALFARCKHTVKRARALDATVLATDLGRAVSHVRSAVS